MGMSWIDQMTIDGAAGWTEKDVVELRSVRNEAIARDAEIARLRAEVERQRCEIERLHGECVRRLIATTGEHGALNATEIARLRADLADHKRALAAGPAALRAMSADYDRKVQLHGIRSAASTRAIIRSADLINAALHVEAAQAAAMKEKP